MLLSPRFRRALTLAYDLHAEQERKGSGVPYISHLIGVASLVLDYGGDEDTAIAALLHDAIEDCGGDIARQCIRETLGMDSADRVSTERILAIVEGCSDTDRTPKPPWRERKLVYINHLATASPETRLVSSADKLHNVRSLLQDYRAVGEALWSRFAGGRDGTLWYYRAVVSALSAAETTPIVAELDRVVTELERQTAGYT